MDASLLLVILAAPALGGQQGLAPDYAARLFFGDAALAGGRLDDARLAFEGCLELSPENPTCAFYLACVEARAGMPDAALEWLERAVLWGYADAEVALFDPDLAALRGARFAELAERMRAAPREGSGPGVPEIVDPFERGGGLRPDGTRCVSMGARSAHLWHVPSGELVASLSGGQDLRDLHFSPDGRWVGGRADGGIRLWDASNGAFGHFVPGAERERERETASLSPASWSASGRNLVVADLGEGERAEAIDLGYGAPFVRPLERPGVREVLALPSPDGTRALTVGAALPGEPSQVESRAALWHLESGAQTLDVRLAAQDAEGARAAFHPDGRWAGVLLAGSPRVFVIDVDAEEAARVLESTSDLRRLCFVPGTPSLLVTSDRFGKLAWWNVETGELEREVQAHDRALERLEVDAAGRLLSTAAKGALRLWSAREGERLWQLDEAGTGPASSALSPDGRWVALGAEILDAGSGARVGHLACPARITAGAFDEGCRLLIACDDGVARVLDLGEGAQISELRHGSPVTAVDVRGTRAATLALDGSALLWELGRGTALARLRAFDEPASRDLGEVAFDPAGARLLARRSGEASLWHAETGERLALLGFEGLHVAAAAWSPDGTRVATAGWTREDGAQRGHVALWSAATGTLELELESEGAAAYAVAFDPAGPLVAAGGADGFACLWDARTGVLERELEHSDVLGEAGVHELVFAPARRAEHGEPGEPGGILLAGLGPLGQVWCWDLATGESRWQRPLGGGRGDPARVRLGCDGPRTYVSGPGTGFTGALETLTGNPVAFLERDGPYSALLSPDGRFVATLDARRVNVYDAGTLEPLCEWTVAWESAGLVRTAAGYYAGPDRTARLTCFPGASLERYAAARLDPKRVRAILCGVPVAPVARRFPIGLQLAAEEFAARPGEPPRIRGSVTNVEELLGFQLREDSNSCFLRADGERVRLSGRAGEFELDWPPAGPGRGARAVWLRALDRHGLASAALPLTVVRP